MEFLVLNEIDAGGGRETGNLFGVALREINLSVTSNTRQ